ncbi:HlyD family secretion protein/adhesin transport system membrane fusion protein [Vibrio crassostreae]|uniref:HlyD family type I secretion periplasmic adaptor subunit n=1 Tax=Vibrio crassostreae TaxID=246167 RepID=UPI000F493A97|nr:HlyD family type I secretion periplasmic adaptor subunit [Vibrio crassostreae]ROO72942.1 HlyD family secretion protein/adhesin transport system membrane fusion protein [Vibrio crassostreae]ROP09923.1 HlyD family secretion protein/adhesin transport system membrane fusion protein [Vibrio crassostreae]ROQ79558.1 HlyD family secretion protein/adhesin transport system membrane fusion protein [Vibrio crassostreae]ROR84764.1 HlyD family secretion protein/adhesin transport system membrane fusion pro
MAKQPIEKGKRYGELVESQNTARTLALATWSVALCVIAFATWSVVTQVDEIAKAKGAVIPEGEKQVLQSDIGGKLKRILVKEGQLVEKGQPLVEFDATFQQTALEELRSQQVTLLASIERMNALLDNREPNFGEFEIDFPEIVSQQKAQLNAQKGLYYQKRIVLEKDSEQIAEQLRSLEKSLPSYEKELSATKQELNILEKGYKSGNISRLRVLEMRQKLASIEQKIEEARGKKAVLIKQADGVEQKIGQLLAEAKVKVSDDRSKAVSDLSALDARVRSSQAKVTNTTLVSPLQGLVQSLPSTKNGGVIQPGGTVVEIVPVGGKADFKARLSPRDIGFVSVGQPTRIKIDAFDYSRFGALKGMVESISPTTSQSERGEIYYEVVVSVDVPYFRDNPESFSILPGMTGEVDITTGEKSVFQYLWKPIYTNVSVAFGER